MRWATSESLMTRASWIREFAGALAVLIAHVPFANHGGGVTGGTQPGHS